MHEMILCKRGEVVLKGLNRRSFEDKLMSNVNRRVSKCGNFRVYSKQSTIYVEPKDDECDIEAAFESCKKIFASSPFQRRCRAKRTSRRSSPRRKITLRARCARPGASRSRASAPTRPSP